MRSESESDEGGAETSGEMATAAAERVAGRYTVLGRLGAGGMGAVYRVRDDTSGRVVALKQVQVALTAAKRSTAEALLQREYHTLARMKHPRIIEVFDYGVTDGGPFYTMELLDGIDLGKVAPLPWRQAAAHARDVASCLALLHAQRLIHRDVTPSNIRLTDDGRAKLMDFGALAPFGVTHEVIGTPNCIAPEVLQHAPLDQRTDLFSLGAVLYFVLTGQPAYSARRIAELPDAWTTVPRAPSSFARDVPPALDGLVLSLLSLDPMARPSSAALVIEQLTAVAGLPPEELDHAAGSYLASGRVVGRASELEWAKQRIDRAKGGRGSQFVMEGRAGIGRTRLLHEICLEAQLVGAIVLKADAERDPQPFGVATALALAFTRSVPELARRAAGDLAPVLAQLDPALADQLGGITPAPPVQDPAERRARLQEALRAWFLAAARERLLFIGVDNLHAADDNSAAFLATLGAEVAQASLVVAATQRLGDRVIAPAPVRLLRRRAGRLKLGALSAEAAVELVQSLFGDVANAARVAHLLFERTGGVPRHMVELAELLVRRNIARYVGGLWVLPEDVREGELPSRADEIVAARLSGLSRASRALAAALSIETRPVTLDRCLALVRGRSEKEAHAALAELLAEQVLSADAGTYRFAQESFRQAVLSQFDDDERRTRHVQAAETLLAVAEPSIGDRVEAAYHLLLGGETGRGGKLLERAGWEFVTATDARESSEGITAALELAYRAYEREPRSDYERAAILFPLIAIAFFSDSWHLVLTEGEKALELGLRITGLGLAGRLRPYLGRHLALIVGLVIGALRFAAQKKRGLSYTQKDAIGWCCVIVPAVSGTGSICLDTARVTRVAELVEPLRLFGPGEVPTLIHRYAEAQRLLMQGREGESRRAFESVREGFLGPKVKETLSEGHWKAIYGGVLFILGVLDSVRGGQEALARAAEIEELNFRVWSMAADQIHLLYHSNRGNSEEVERRRARVELSAVQGRTTWQTEVFLPVLLLTGDALAADAMGVRRCWEQLERRSKAVPSLAVFAVVARAVYLGLRGEHAEAISLFEGALPMLPVQGRNAWHVTRSQFARVLNAAGEHQRARALLVESIAARPPVEAEFIVEGLELERQLALAEAGLGLLTAAAARLDALIERWGTEENPLLVGLLHRARAEVAAHAGDLGALDHHRVEMERHFRASKNPALIVQIEELGRLASQLVSGYRSLPVEGQPLGSLAPFAAVGLSELSKDPDVWECALRLILRRSQATAGYLYAFTPEGLYLMASSSSRATPVPVEEELKARLARLQDELEQREGTDDRGATDDPDETDETEIVHDDGEAPVRTAVLQSAPPPPGGPYRTVPLVARDGRPRVVGGVILHFAGAPGPMLHQEFLDAVANAVQHRVTTSVSQVAS